MTINELQHLLIQEIESLTSDMYITDSHGERTALKGYPQMVSMVDSSVIGLNESDDKKYPYFLVRLDKVEYRKKDADGANQAHLFIGVNICDSDIEPKGFYTLAVVLDRIIYRFQKNPILGAFWCERSMNSIFQKDYELPYYKGEIEMFWNLPNIEMEEVYGE
nr:MAG TPA: hypothetical protein [Caudoviricetes sp.]